MSTNPTNRIAERRRFIRERTAQLEAELSTLVSEANELDIAERVLARFSDAPTLGGNVEKTAPVFDPADDSEEHTQPLTLPEMVFTILREAKAEGRKGADSAEILKIVRARWKPEFTAENVRPTLWRMVKQQRLKKRGKTYCLPVVAPQGEPEAVGASGLH